MDFLTIGEVLVDFSQTAPGPQGFPQYEALPGGAPANVAAALAKWGRRSGIIGQLGQDALGRLLASTLEQAGVDTSRLRPSPERTSLAMVSLSAEGERSFAFYWKDTSCASLDPSLTDPSISTGSRIFHFGSVTLSTPRSRATTLAAVRTAKASGACISFDANLRPGLWAGGAQEARDPILEAMGLADLVKLSEEELGFLCGSSLELRRDDPATRREMTQLRSATGTPLLFVTFGKHGARWEGPHGSGSVDSLPVRALDTTGAGDCFMAGVLQQWLATSGPVDRLNAADYASMARHGCAAGALSTLVRGGIPSIPALAEIVAKAASLEVRS
jgi:sugar/nucleoside kinase (ribokinase family)